MKKSIPSEAGNFNWSMYDGNNWNGTTLYVNKNLKTKKGTKVYCHESYAQEVAKKYLHDAEPVSKELKKNVTVAIDDLMPMNSNCVLASINRGSNSIVIDLNKEQRFLNTLQSDNEVVTKEKFIEMLNDPEIRKMILDMKLTAKVGTDIEKASIWDGYVEDLSNEMKAQIKKPNKAYMAKILISNNGGFVVEVANTIRAFMPGSMAAPNKLVNYEELVGREMEVMVESYDEKHGFVVSRKKYLNTIAPYYMNQILDQVKENPDLLLNGTVTGTTNFGIFVELDDNECITGMLHKTLISDELRDLLRKNEIKQGYKVQVYVHGVEKNRLVFSDVPTADRQAVITKREAEDDQEKLANVRNRAAAIRSNHLKQTVNVAELLDQDEDDEE